MVGRVVAWRRMVERGSPAGWCPVVARVLWQSESRGRQRPGAVHWAGERFTVTEVLEAWTEAAAAAESEHRRVFVVRDVLGQLWRIRDISGEVEVELAESSRRCVPDLGRGR